MLNRLIGITIIIITLLLVSVNYTSSSTRISADTVLSKKTYSLADRYNNKFVNSVFSDNILLTLSYMDGSTKSGHKVNWQMVHKDFTYQFVLQPHKTFAFHDQVLPTYKNNIELTTNAHFDSREGFRYDGWLVGDGVCHLASFMNVVARQAGLEVVAPTPHNFAKIADVPRKYGVAIYYSANSKSGSSLQNLYITNPFDKPIVFVFKHDRTNLEIKVEKQA